MADETRNPESIAPVEKLDPTLWKPTEDDWKFFRKTISEDETEVRRRVLYIQAKCVVPEVLQSAGALTVMVL